MSQEITRILQAIEDADDVSVADQLLPLVYEELRKLAAVRLGNDVPCHSRPCERGISEALKAVDLVPRETMTLLRFSSREKNEKT
jgi:hypothetical protein